MLADFITAIELEILGRRGGVGVSAYENGVMDGLGRAHAMAVEMQKTGGGH